MRKIVFILAVLFLSCDSDDESNGECIDPEKWGEITACPEHLDYVCGCNNVTYGNDCFAKAAGVVSWTKGECN